MRKDLSKFNEYDFNDIKITYLLGAGASYNAIPIWKGQGKSMLGVSRYIKGYIDDNERLKKEETKILHENATLNNLADRIGHYGNLAIQYGSIDIYAKRLHLLGDLRQLDELKFCLSIYFDLWENFINDSTPLNNEAKYTKVDKRYLSLLSVLLEKGLDKSNPKLNKNISFISWNYDLQLEFAYESFMENKAASLSEVNEGLSFMEEKNRYKEVIHLNGHRGNFIDGGKYYDNVPNLIHGSIDNYLLGLQYEKDDFRAKSYKNCIKYAWEHDSNSLKDALEIMKSTNILVIIGYSFPSFNRRIDAQLINAFQENDDYLDIIYQDPNGNEDIIDALFDKPANVRIERKNVNQFYIPNEYLFPPSA
jgi:hypothetical protein